MIDLHIHTNKSDGMYTPREIIDMAYSNGINKISITDHDTVSAYTKDLIEYAKTNFRNDENYEEIKRISDIVKNNFNN